MSRESTIMHSVNWYESAGRKAWLEVGGSLDLFIKQLINYRHTDAFEDHADTERIEKEWYAEADARFAEAEKKKA